MKRHPVAWVVGGAAVAVVAVLLGLVTGPASIRPWGAVLSVFDHIPGVHLRSDTPFNLNSDPTFRVIPKHALPADLAISHQAYDRTDALQDINLVFPIERLRELEAGHVIGRLAEDHYGFGLMGSAEALMPAIKEVARRIAESGVDLALLVPA